MDKNHRDCYTVESLYFPLLYSFLFLLVQVAAAMLGAGASSSEDLEADAYWMFTAVMDGLEGFYEHRVDAAHLRGRSRPASREVARGRGSRGGDRDGLDSPVVEMCKRLQGSRMQKVDPGLQRHLAAMDISPQVRGGGVGGDWGLVLRLHGGSSVVLFWSCEL